MRKILIVEDEEVLRESYRIILSTEPYQVSVAGDGNQALKLCRQTTFDLILLDLRCPAWAAPNSSKNTALSICGHQK